LPHFQSFSWIYFFQPQISFFNNDYWDTLLVLTLGKRTTKIHFIFSRGQFMLHINRQHDSAREFSPKKFAMKILRRTGYWRKSFPLIIRRSFCKCNSSLLEEVPAMVATIIKSSSPSATSISIALHLRSNLIFSVNKAGNNESVELSSSTSKVIGLLSLSIILKLTWLNTKHIIQQNKNQVILSIIS